MTKQEIRIITLAKARIKPLSVVYDIGSGTGSLTVEAALLAPQGRVFALEKNAESFELTKANIEHFGLENVQVMQTVAPQGLTNLPPADAIIIGGSGGNLSQILTICLEQLISGGRLVLNAITIETLTTAMEFLEHSGFQEIEAVAITVARLNKVGQSHMWQGLNPVYIISATKAES